MLEGLGFTDDKCRKTRWAYWCVFANITATVIKLFALNAFVFFPAWT